MKPAITKYPAALKVKIQGQVTPESIQATLTKAFKDASSETGLELYWRNATIYINACDEYSETYEIEPIFYSFGSEGFVTHMSPTEGQPESVQQTILLRETLRESHAALMEAQNRFDIVWKELGVWIFESFGSFSFYIKLLHPYVTAVWEENPVKKKTGSKKGQDHNHPELTTSKYRAPNYQMELTWCQKDIPLTAYPTDTSTFIEYLTAQLRPIISTHAEESQPIDPKAISRLIQDILFKTSSFYRSYTANREELDSYLAKVFALFWANEFPGYDDTNPLSEEHDKWMIRVFNSWANFYKMNNAYKDTFNRYEKAQKEAFMDHGFRMPGLKGIIKGYPRQDY